ncbi:hypothetical protein PG984_006640 [Apiospora sp. TS-2023a]
MNDDPAIECAKSIACLHWLHEVPNSSRKNPWTRQHLREGQGYTLSFTDERNLTGVLAFLSGISNDSNCVTAVCVRENRQTSGLEVLLAINRGEADMNSDVLRKVKNGLETIFEVLGRAPADGPETENDAFSTIVSMCKDRILRRLRLFRLPRDQEKQSIKETWRRCRDSLKKGKKLSKFKALVKTADEAMTLVDEWDDQENDEQKLEALKALVLKLSCLQQQKNPSVRILVNEIPIRNQGPDRDKVDEKLKISFLNIIEKVARYRESARFLCYLVRKYSKHSLFRQLKIVHARLPSDAFKTTELGRIEANFAFKMSQGSLMKVRGLLGQRRQRDANEEQVRQARETLKEGKVHAEIQLFFYCHGLKKFEFPHGWLWPGWRLPNVENTDLYLRFVEYLDNRIQKSVAWMLRHNGKIYHGYPNESTLITLPGSKSTLYMGATRHGYDLDNDQGVSQNHVENDVEGDRHPLQPPPLEIAEAVMGSMTLESPKVSNFNVRDEESLPIVSRETEDTRPPEPNGQRLKDNASNLPSCLNCLLIWFPKRAPRARTTRD